MLSLIVIVAVNFWLIHLYQPTLDVSESDFEKCFNVNVRSIFHATSVAIPALIAQGSGGVMLNIASIGSLRPRPGLTWYNASKAAVWNVSLQESPTVVESKMMARGSTSRRGEKVKSNG